MHSWIAHFQSNSLLISSVEQYTTAVSLEDSSWHACDAWCFWYSKNSGWRPRLPCDMGRHSLVVTLPDQTTSWGPWWQLLQVPMIERRCWWQELRSIWGRCLPDFLQSRYWWCVHSLQKFHELTHNLALDVICIERQLNELTKELYGLVDDVRATDS